jgi:hypothetical protein
MFENRMLRRIFGPKRDEATGEWRRPYDEELHDLYCIDTSGDQITKNEMEGTCGGEERCIQRSE